MKRKSIAVLPLLFAALLVVSCATVSVPVTRQKPSDIDMTGIKKVAILPVYFPSDVTESPIQDGIAKCAPKYRWKIPAEHEISSYMIAKLTKYFEKSTSYKVVDNSEIAKCIPVDEKAEAAKKASLGSKLVNTAKSIISGEDASDEVSVTLDPTTVVDAYIIYTITTMSGTHDTEYGTRKNSEGKNESITTETSVFTLEYTLAVYRASDYSLIGEKYESKVVTFIEEGPDAFFNVKTDKDLTIEAFDASFADLVHAFMPYSVDEALVLEKDSSKSADMKAAEKLAAKRKYSEALALYSKVYSETDSFSAGYNAALMTELAGDLPGAIAAMDTLFQASGNPKAAAELMRMEKTLADQARLEEQARLAEQAKSTKKTK